MINQLLWCYFGDLSLLLTVVVMRGEYEKKVSYHQQISQEADGYRSPFRAFTLGDLALILQCLVSFSIGRDCHGTNQPAVASVTIRHGLLASTPRRQS